MLPRLVLCFVLLCGWTRGSITHRRIGRSQRRLVPIELSFGFEKRGRVDITLSKIKAFKTEEISEVRLDNFGLILVSTAVDAQVNQETAEGRCLLSDQRVLQIFNFGEWKTDDTGVIVRNVKFEEKGLEPGEYTLYFLGCTDDMFLNFNIRIAFYSETEEGDKNFLSVGERPLPGVYLFMFLVFSVMSMTWAKVCYTERNHIHGIHYLMFGLVVIRSVVYFTQAGMYNEDRLTGSPEGWNVAYYIFTFLRGVMFFVVIILIGTGWSYLRPYIGDNEKKILVVVIPLQVFANIAIIVLNETSPVRDSFFTLTDLFHLVDIICCCAILFPIVWSIKHLREGAESDGKSAVNVEKLTLFRQFYVLVVVYIYFTRIIVYLLDNTLPYEYKWASQLASEAATLVFYVTVGMKFRPHKENVYLKLESDAAL